ncbi:hypothetical protein QBC33DRAFT_569920 [Phialemonium atrogriseum]|uniref:Uncharacterized protein n=1 Tax=Phialemonium atrogriseum TaxID=1093897 RepID=A0AAJ0C2M8_9PEZI|nr:uncharacterized protein QBC33DRAFT_569920 [Phialemonium atrogriseum]KAK1767599.1 hypothetical protein QBC33DRAFT_569920 [Phialemonium atrogriseum]
MGCCSSKEDYYDIPRREDNLPGRTHFPKTTAQSIIAQAPAPTHNKAQNARRPHAHYDDENLFANERIKLTPLPGIALPNNNRPAPVLWAYPANNFDYTTQNRFGRPMGGNGVDAGPMRIVTDRNRNIQGMILHPLGDPVTFERAQERNRRRPDYRADY